MSAINTMLFVATASLVIGIFVSIVFFLLGSLYIIPYTMWLGCRLEEGQYKHLEKTGLWTSFQAATKLYRHWIFRKELEL